MQAITPALQSQCLQPLRPFSPAELAAMSDADLKAAAVAKMSYERDCGK